MEISTLIKLVKDFFAEPPIWFIIAISIIAFIAVVAQWALYTKCNLPGYACLIPVWNVIIFLKIVGRPAKHGIYVMLPPLLIIACYFLPNIYVAIAIGVIIFIGWLFFLALIYIEICQSFGKYDMGSYISILLFNGFYLLNLAMNEEEEYKGPVYGKPKMIK
jgi:hypothetical protein